MPDDRKTYVLVHGIWHGGWCWARVAEILRNRGHRVTTPTHSGLGERCHLMSPSITLTTFVEDVVNHLVFEDLRDVVLVGHSFGGLPILGAADRVPDRIAKLIFLDAAILHDGECWLDLLPPEIAQDRARQADAASGGVSLPPAPVGAFGVTQPDDIAFVESRLTPHPFATFTTPLHLSRPPGNGLPLAYIRCTDPVYPPAVAMHERARIAGWQIADLATGHDAMVTAPAATADLLEQMSA